MCTRRAPAYSQTQIVARPSVIDEHHGLPSRYIPLAHLSPLGQVLPLNPTRRLPSPRPATLQRLLYPLLRLPAPLSTHHPPHPSLFLHLHLPLPLAGLQALLEAHLCHPHRPTLVPHARAPRSRTLLIAQSTGCLASDDHLLGLHRRAAGDMGRCRRRGVLCLLPWCRGEHRRRGLAAGCLIGLGERGEERGVQASVVAAE